ncbi:PAS domain S-box protein [Nitrogeniibacter mangrovi]|uniref:histidine kinase n=2 Tax=Nitrogeniibacter mangrovi TaxID=2016596 RepID=A0A6C1BC71_9RHOO|nr:PAS domain S-box protein [Nitrogeniibacter mangrovi]
MDPRKPSDADRPARIGPDTPTLPVSALSVAAALMDADGHCVQVNAAFARLLSRSIADLEGQPCAHLLPGGAERIRTLMAQARALGTTQCADLVDDAARPAPSIHRVRCQPLADDRLLVSVEPAPTPQANDILDHLVSFVGVLAPDGTVLEANRASLDAAGIALEAVRGRKFWDCHWWQHSPQTAARIREAVDQAAAGASPRFDIGKRMAGEQIVTIDLILSPVRDAAGAITHLIYSAIDVSSRKAGEAALQRSEQRFRQVVESAPDGLAMVDPAGRMVLVNSSMERLFGHTREEMLGQGIEMLMPERHRHGHDTLFRGYMSAPEARDMAGRRELYARRKDGSEFPVEIGLNPIGTESGTMVLATIQDVTTRKADRRMIEKALEEKTVLLHEIHHRVKNNLQIISSLLNLQARSADPSVRQALSESQGRVKAMALIHQLLYERNDFSRIDLASYLRRLCALLQESFRDGPARFELNVRAEEEVHMDLQRAVPCGLLVNELVTNAIKHAFPDGRHGHVEVTLTRQDASHCLIVVADDGIGLPADIDPGRSRSLGMQLIPLLCDQAGGAWAVSRAPGTRFELTLDTTEREAT